MFKYFPHLVFIIVVGYLLYSWYINKSELEIKPIKQQTMINDTIPVYTPQRVPVASHAQPMLQTIISTKIDSLSENDMGEISSMINKDNFNYTIIEPYYEKIKSGKSFLYSGLSLREALLTPYLGSTIGSNLFYTFKKLFVYDDTHNNNSTENSVLAYHCNLNKILINTGKIKIANSVWNNGVNINPNFKNFISNIAQIKNGISQAAVNDWVNKQTNGMINTIPVNENQDVAMIIINALYFCDKWVNKFNKEKTHKRIFTNYLQKEINVEMMHQTNDYLYVESESYQSIAMDYKSDFCMVVVLPIKNVKPILLNQNEISTLYNEMRPIKVKLYFPKFTYENTHSSLLPLITDAGFNITEANYSNMTKSEYDKIYISAIIQKTKIEVDEEGTKAAAVTATQMMYNSVDTQKKETIFLADHSFSYFIIHKPTFEVLFTGVFNG
jgi:serine protease inhibitor